MKIGTEWRLDLKKQTIVSSADVRTRCPAWPHLNFHKATQTIVYNVIFSGESFKKNKCYILIIIKNILAMKQ